MAVRSSLALCIYSLYVAATYVNAATLYPYGDNNRDRYLPKQNDVASAGVELRYGLPFFNQKYWTLFVNDNGVISLNNAYTKYDNAIDFRDALGPDTEFDPPLERILIFPFWANVDSSIRGYVYYRQTTEYDLMVRAADEIHRGFVEFDDFMPKVLIIATWVDVGFFGDTGGNNPRNTFQCVIATDEIESFAIFIYDQISWTTGTESGGVPDTGLTGNPALVGFNAGDGYTTFKHDDSGKDSVRNLPGGSNVDIAGLFVYHISPVQVEEGGCKTKDVVKTFPRYDSMLGHSVLYIQGECLNEPPPHKEDIWLMYGELNDPIAITNCTWMSKERSWCIVPFFFQVGQIPIYVSEDGGLNYFYEGTFYIVDIGDVPPGVVRIDPRAESWMLADRPVAIEWDASRINYTMINIDILAYTETDGIPSWEEVEDVAYDAENTGRYEWIPRARGRVTSENAVGVIRITRRWKKDEFALWSDVHWLGYILNDKFQRAPAVYSNQRCEEWYEKMAAEPEWNFDMDLNPCPCDLSQALADRGRFRPLSECDMSTAGRDDNFDYCYLREGIKHCVIDIINSPQAADSVCCYDFKENLVYAGDSFSGSFSHRVTANGFPPYNTPKTIPVMSSWVNDILPYYSCCVWGDLCEYYQEYRPTRDCRWYDPPRMATVFGDPHFITFDGVSYTFNGKGEYTLMRATSEAQNRFVLQGRTEQMLSWNARVVQATRLTSVAMKEEDLENIEIQYSPRTILQVVYQGNYLRIDSQTRLSLPGFYLTFPKVYEYGNVTQVVVTFLDSKIGVVVNGTADGLFLQVIIPDEFKGYVEGLLGNWNDDPDDDLTSSGGTRVNPNDTAQVIYEQFARSWELTDSLFQYQPGRGHAYYQDNEFVPAWSAPDGSLPDYISTNEIDEICNGNEYCIYDIQSTGILQLGKATKKAYDDYILSKRALQKIPTCQYIRTPKNGTKTFLRERNHNVGSELEFRCDEDFVPVGPEYRVCQPLASGQPSWSGGIQEEVIDNSCLESTLCGGLKTPWHGSIAIADAAPERLEVAYSCDVGYERYGNQYRHCRQRFERWSGYMPGCYRKLNPLELGLAIVGGIVGAVLIVAAIVLIFVWAGRKDRKEKRAKREAEIFSDIEMKPSSTAASYSRRPPPVDDPDVPYPTGADTMPYPPSSAEKSNKGYASESWA